MSLDPRDSHRRGRSKSPGRERERSRSRVDERERSRTRVIERVPSPPTTRYDDRDSRYDYEEETIRKSSRRADVVQADPRDYRDPRDSRDKLADPRDPRYVSSSSKYRSSSPMPGSYVEEEDVRVKYSGGREKDYYAEKTSKYGKKDKYQRDDSPPSRYTEADVYKYEVESRGREKERERERELEIAQRERERIYEEEKQKRERGSSFHLSGGVNTSYLHGGVDINHRSPSPSRGRYSPPSKKPDPLAYGDAPPDIAGRSYADPKQWQYAAPQETITYSSRNEREKVYPRPEATHQQSYESGSHSRHNSYVGDSARSSKSQIVTVEPGSRHRRDSSPPGGLAPRMHSLSVSTAHHGGASLSLANAPGSPLLESYHGTYQSISPMPSPLMIAHSSDLQVVESISPLSSDDERGGRGKKKRSARFHDPEEEAMALAKALKGEKRAPDTEPLIEILPSLTHDQVLDLRVEYKRIVKTGSEKKGVNIAKHIKMRLKEEDPSLMKACYVCALGKWESEAYWANFWYQGEKSRRELLIESLMGRTNREIREIKDGFSDKKYSDSLMKCMKTELKEDKFKKAVLLVLEEKRMDERPGLPVDRRLVEEDVRDLHKAVKSERGGESAMINIVVVRGDNHLREILRLYESTYRANFAREMLKKSGNLVGELLAHILNGVINKPVRDALLLHHALSLSKSDSIRTELLISRLVRYHWDRPHFEAVKKEYRNRYGTDLQRAVAEGTKGEWGRFCEQLCLRRQGDEIKRIL